jgi:hypothetical protein
MRRVLTFLLGFCWATLPMPAGFGDNATARVPILVELFTSEGCSDCPPADAFLQKLDQQPFPGAELIVLSEHVDYWNHDGWKDPYSSHYCSERQAAYARAFDLRTAYTPQMVVDGSSQFVGSDQAAASKAFEMALTVRKLDVRLSSISIDPANTLRIHLEISALPPHQKANAYVAIALNQAQSQVSAGENAGRKLSHTAVARLITKVGSIQTNQPFGEDLHIQLPPNTPASNLRVVAFVQQEKQGRILGATMQPAP